MRGTSSRVSELKEDMQKNGVHLDFRGWETQQLALGKKSRLGGKTVWGRAEQAILGFICQGHAHLREAPRGAGEDTGLLAFPPTPASITFADVLWELDFRLLGRKGQDNRITALPLPLPPPTHTHNHSRKGEPE